MHKGKISTEINLDTIDDDIRSLKNFIEILESKGVGILDHPGFNLKISDFMHDDSVCFEVAYTSKDGNSCISSSPESIENLNQSNLLRIIDKLKNNYKKNSIGEEKNDKIDD